MSDDPAPAHAVDNRASRYRELIAEAADVLDDRLARIRGDYDRREITIREAADERVTVMSEHLATLARLRLEYLQ